MTCSRVLNPKLQLCFTFLFLLLFSALPALAQTGSLHGTVADPTGAVIPSATVTATGQDGTAHTATSTASGAYSVEPLAPGHYTVSATATGFAAFDPVDVQVFSERVTTKNLTLQLPVDVQQVQVTSQTQGLDVSADNNAGAIVIKGKDLDALSDDPDELQNELTALAGPAAGPNGGQIYIDGFTGGQLPPKSSIREIRINQNPFSAQYDKLGYGRIEILTKPGTDKLRGSFMMAGNSSAFNSLTPFVTSEPSYYSTFMVGNAGGPLTKTSSWFANIFRRDNQSNAIVNAVVLDTTGNAANYSIAVSNPQTRMDFSPRFDFQLGQKNTMTVRYSFNRQTDTGDGVSGLSLQSQAYDVRNQENVLQISDSQVINDHTVNETRFQYMRDRNNQTALSTDPTVSVTGSFTGGGNNTGVSRTNQDQFELQNYTLMSKGAHSLNFGGRLRVSRTSGYTNAGFNGAYTYTSLANYKAHTPSEYNVTAGNPSALVNYFDVGVYAQDDYKFKPNLTLSYGIRWETQSSIGDYSDVAPRLSFAWAPGAKNGKPAKTVIRGGYGWFFDRFGASNVLQTIRHNGVNQQQYVVKNPSFYQNAPSAAQLAALSTTAAPTIYTLGSNLKAAVNMQAAIGVERQFGKAVTIAATYINSRGVHEFLSDNINAYDPATYNATTGTGTRPNGINENIYQYQSGGIYKQNQLMVNYTVRANKVSLFGFYALGFANADTSGVSSFPTNQSNPGADYGRASFDVRSRFLLGGNYTGPFGVSFSPMMDATSGSPFNITVGQDLNGDNQYNDRPAFATSASTSTMTTPYGKFDLNPAWDAQRIPINMGTGPAQFSLNMRVSKSIGIGPKVAKSQAASSGGGPGGGGPGGPGGGGPGGGGPGGGLGPGGLSRSGGPPRLDQDTARRYSLNFSAMARNVFNDVNMAAPNGVLSSSLFGKSTSLAGGFFGSAAANRTIDFQVSFNF
ncbi:MAG: TonB-dependent receptor [Terracidiphilus sp.]|nr:TonB-dependent receptor [Terracidiphilus sp.]